MPLPSKPGRLKSKEEEIIPPRRVRHITSIQVRNLTPFPVRDDSASALVQPSEQPQFAAHGHLSDDLDLTLSRKRGRRRSSVSVHTFSSRDAPAASSSPNVQDSAGRQRLSSKAGPVGTSNGAFPGSPKARPAGGPPVARPAHRARTSSTTSSLSQFSSSAFEPTTSSLPLPGLLSDTSQPALEKVLQARLVETFLTIAIPHSEDIGEERQSPPEPTGQNGRANEPQPDSARLARRNTVVASASSGISPASKPTKRDAVSRIASTRPPALNHARTASLPHAKAVPKPSAPHTLPRSTISGSRKPSSVASGPSRPATPESSGPHEELPVIPDFLSPIHRPSTNPSFSVDARESVSISKDADLAASCISVEIWGKVVDSHTADTSKGKGKERLRYADDTEINPLSRDWKVLEHWEVDLNDLIPLPDDLVLHPSRLPSNTLCVTLDPPGQVFYLPSARFPLGAPPRSRSPSPGYNSDGESGVRVRQLNAEAPSRPILHVKARVDGSPTIDPASRVPGRKGIRKSATWQDLFKLVTLQTIIKDTAGSLSEVVQEIDRIVTTHGTSILTREASERDARVNELRKEANVVGRESESLRERLAAKKDELKRRREVLRQARDAHEQDLQDEALAESSLQHEKQQLTQLRQHLPIIRNSLITSIAFIYPIELLSPPDLLFTILGVPLPIPSGPTDPAPPLSLPSHKEVTEDTVATALGYAAQVVHFLGAYLGIVLTYPVTCVGSRSLIKDGISAMVGPRMFPLFSKGVDTYRFEYAVFLLNKDIELLMTERNLRALDMRHTLPNLKNLLLTLTDPDTVQRIPLRPPSVASATISALQSPVIAPASDPAADDELSLASAETGADDDDGSDGDSQPASGSATPTKAAEPPTTPTGTVRKSRGFLDLAPLSGFFKARYPSSTRGTVKADPPLEDEGPGEATPTVSSTSTVPAVVETPAEGSGGSEEVEDDRRTIRASTSEDGVAEQKHRTKHQAGRGMMNGNGAAHGLSHEPEVGEKVVDTQRSASMVDGIS